MIVPENNIHFYSQSYAHDDAFIVATKDGLIALRQAIDIAINNVEIGHVDAQDNCGEVFSLRVICVNKEVFDTMMPPYGFPGVERIGKHPWDIIKPR